MTSLPVSLMTSVSVIIISVQVHLKNLYHVLYTHNKDFKATLKSVEEAESFIKAVIGVSAIKFKSYIF